MSEDYSSLKLAAFYTLLALGILAILVGYLLLNWSLAGVGVFLSLIGKVGVDEQSDIIGRKNEAATLPHSKILR